MPKLPQIEFGSSEASMVVKADREYELSLKYLKNILDPTDAEMELMQEWDEVIGAQDEYKYAENALRIAENDLLAARKAVLEERQHEARTSK